MGVEARQRFGVDAIERTVAVSPVAAQEVVHEQAHVAGPLPERRQRDRDHVDAEEEVLPELALPDELRGVSVRRRHEADVHVHEPGRPDASDLPFLKRPEELGLQRPWELPDLVEEQRAAVRDLDHPRLDAVRASERAALVAEQLRLEQGGGQRGTVHGHEDLGCARALGMDGPGD